MKKGIMKLIVLAALVCAVLSCGMGITSGVQKGAANHKDEDVAPEDKVVFTGSGIFYYLPDLESQGSGKETFKYAEKAVTEGKAIYKDSMYFSKEYALKDISLTFRRDKTYCLKETLINPKTEAVIDSDSSTGTYSISNGQLVRSFQFKGDMYEEVYLISHDGEALVLKSVDTPQQRSASGIRPIYTLTQSSGLLNVFSK
jgi:lipoprotein